MKFGMRIPSVKRSVKAMTTGRVKRAVKKAVNPFYGRKGMGVIRNPKKALYNFGYKRTTFGGISGSRKSLGCCLYLLIIALSAVMLTIAFIS